MAVVQPAGDLANWHPHVHALVSRGGWTGDWVWVPVPFVDEYAAELLFRHKVMRLLQDVGLLTEERTELLLSWRHSGFSVHNRVRVEPEDQSAVERLAREASATGRDRHLRFASRWRGRALGSSRPRSESRRPRPPPKLGTVNQACL